MDGTGIVKTYKFSKPRYLGDPINIVRIFSEKEVDEIVLLDIRASKEGLEPNFALLSQICGEAFMPVAYGGGVKTLEQIEKLIRLGIDKVVINSAIEDNLNLIFKASKIFGSQAVVASIDIKKKIFGGYKAFTMSGSKEVAKNYKQYIYDIIQAGAGEIFLNNIDRDGTMEGYDINLIKEVSTMVNVPLIVCGGAGKFEDLKKAINEGGASAVAAGSLFVFHGKHKAVLISYPDNLCI